MNKEQWKSERDKAIENGEKEKAQWIDETVLFPISNVINSKYRHETQFCCPSCNSRVCVIFGTDEKYICCIGCGKKYVKYHIDGTGGMSKVVIDE